MCYILKSMWGLIRIELIVGGFMVDFAKDELALPIRKILWAPTNAAHHNHLHVEGPHVSGTLAQCTSKWTEAITTIRGALDGHFGEGDHYMVDQPDLAWTHMGVFNCRNIAGTNTPSQHAFSNAIDIGPYYGVAQQQKFYDFLTRKEDEVTEQEIINAVKKALGIYSRTDHTGDVYDHSRVVSESVWQIGFGRGENTRYPSSFLAETEKYAKLAASRALTAIAEAKDDSFTLNAEGIKAIVDAIVEAGVADAVADELAVRLTKPSG